jgi:hypothetical protein
MMQSKYPAFTHRVLGVFLFVLLNGCGSVLVTYEDAELSSEKKTIDSLPYYLPKGRIEAAGAWSKDANAFVVTATTVIEAEAGPPHWVKRNVNPFFDDTIALTVNGKGLLQTANATSQDQTTAAVAGLVAAAGNALSFGAGVGPIPKDLACGGPQADAILPTVFQCSLDPEQGILSSDPMWLEVPTAAGATRKAVQFSVEATRIGHAAAMPEARSKTGRPLNGVIVRLNMPYEVIISQVASATRPGTKDPKDPNPLKDCWTLQTAEKAPAPKRVVVLIPDKAHSYVLPLARTATVSRETNVGLVDGTVQTLTMKRESVVLGIVRIPQTILAALVPIPLNIRQTVANNYQAVDNTLKAQADIKKLQNP